MVTNTMKGIRRTLGTAPAQKAPALTDDIRAMVDAADAGLIGARDRALVLLGFAGAFRRSELVALDIADCDFSKDGLTVTLRRSKTDQEGRAARSAFPMDRILRLALCAPCKRGWKLAAIAGGPLFCSITRHGQIAAGPAIVHRRGARREETGAARRTRSRRSTRGTRFGPGTLPARPLRGRRSAPS